MLERHVRFGLQADAGAEDVGQGPALLGQGIDDGRARWRERGFEHVAQDGEDAVEGFVLLAAASSFSQLVAVAVAVAVGGSSAGVGAGIGPPLNASHHFRDEHEIDDEGRGEKGVLTDVEDSMRVFGQSYRSQGQADEACFIYEGKRTKSSGGRP